MIPEQQTKVSHSEPAVRFVRLWKAAQSSSGSNGDLGSAVDQLIAEQARRLRAGEPVRAEEFIARLPEPRDSEAVLDLIYNEYLLREESKNAPGEEEFCRRFPEFADQLLDQIAFHRAMNHHVSTLPVSNDAGPITVADDSDGESDFESLPRPFGRYRLVSLLGRGGMGSVYLAEDSTLDRKVALKMPRTDGAGIAADRFRREARAAAALSHPNLCPVIDVGRMGGRNFLTMPFLDGEPLSARLSREGRLSPPEALRLIRIVADAMAYAHRSGVIHRDLKPSNIMMTESGEPIVMDFGLARIDASREKSLTSQGAIIGTAAYMPPEQIGCDPERIGPRSDIYSLGVILYELLTGKVPFTGSPADVLRMVLTEEPPSVSAKCKELDPRLDAICRRAIAKVPEQRFASMEEFSAALVALSEPKAIQPKNKRRRLIGFFAMLMACVITYTVISSNRPAASSSVESRDEMFAQGRTWRGEYRFLPKTDNQPESAELIVESREGSSFDGLYKTCDGKFIWKVKGIAASGKVSWTLGEARTDAARETGAQGNGVLRGEYDSNKLTAIYEDKDSSAELLLLPVK